MAWERRGEKSYFYVSQRLGSRVVKRYIGSGAQAADIAQSMERSNACRRAVAERIRAETERTQEAVGLMAESELAITQHMEALLLATGFHRQNYGPWRSRRGSNT